MFVFLVIEVLSLQLLPSLPQDFSLIFRIMTNGLTIHFQINDVDDGNISETDRLSFLDFPAPSSSLYMSLPSGYDIADFFGDPFA
jgi:hypothetical protein